MIRRRRTTDQTDEQAMTTTTPDTGADGDPEGEPIPVDSPGRDKVTALDIARNGERRPVRPAWARSGEQFKTAAAWMAGHYAHTTAFHGVRAPVFAFRMLLRSRAVRCGAQPA